MTEEMVGGQHRNDESDTDLSVRGEQTNANDRRREKIRLAEGRTGVPNDKEKRFLQVKKDEEAY